VLSIHQSCPLIFEFKAALGVNHALWTCRVVWVKYWSPDEQLEAVERGTVVAVHLNTELVAKLSQHGWILYFTINQLLLKIQATRLFQW